ncbi:MAG: tetratricopeptide repeat-containing sulfotransferase family protein [Pseudomonadota bacterium]
MTEDAAGALSHARSCIRSARFDDARTALQGVLAAGPDPAEEREALYSLAVAERYRGCPAAGLEVLDRLLGAYPDHARGHQERGHALRAQGHDDRAVAAFREAVARNPALIASWRALAELHRAAGRDTDARAAQQRLEALERQPRDLVEVTALIHDDDLAQAERLCRHFLQQHKHHPEGMRLLAEIALRLGIYDDAEFLLESCAELAPEYLPGRLDYLNILVRKTRFQRAHDEAQALLERQPHNPAVETALASALVGLGRLDEGMAVYARLLERQPENWNLHLQLGHARKTAGDFEGAIASYRRAYALKPDFGDAFWSLANTKTYRFTDDELAHIERYERAPEVGVDDRIHLCFAAGKAHEDRGDVDAAFSYYERGNALKRRELRYDPQQIERRVESQMTQCTAELFEKHEGAGCTREDPIFVVGLPRSGSTLLEQILASHSMVDGTMELHNVLALAQRLRGRTAAKSSRYPRILHELDTDYFRRFGEKYLEDTRVYRAGAPLFVDKMPNNFLHVGLIRLMLPNAKVIDARREPMACCFSNFKQLFGEGQEFSYGLHEVGRYYKAYVRLMDHWDAVLPGFVLRVQHEDVIDDLEGQVRRILEFCGLPFEQACLEFHTTERSIKTPSSEQVRQPIYRSAMDQWRRFERHLGPLREALGAEVLSRGS